MTTIKDLHSAQAQSARKGQIDETRRDSKPSREETTATAQQGDSVKISSAGAQLTNISEALENVPVVNSALVSRIQGAVDSGSYQVSSERIAEKVITSELEKLSATPDQ